MDLLLAGVHDRHELLPHTFRGRVRLRLFAENDDEEAKRHGMSTDRAVELQYLQPPQLDPPSRRGRHRGNSTGATATGEWRPILALSGGLAAVVGVVGAGLLTVLGRRRP